MWCCFSVGGLGLSLPFEEVFRYMVAKSYRNNFNETKSNEKICEKQKKTYSALCVFCWCASKCNIIRTPKKFLDFFLYILLDDEDESDLHEKT